MRSIRRIVLFWTVATALFIPSGTDFLISGALAAENELVVFAAASTTNAMGEIGALHEARGMGHVTFSFASSSTLAKQIESGAPADLFVSADLPWMTYLEEKKKVAPENR